MSDGTRRKHAERADPQTWGGPVEARVWGGWGEGPPAEHLRGVTPEGGAACWLLSLEYTGKPRRAKLTVSEACLNV